MDHEKNILVSPPCDLHNWRLEQIEKKIDMIYKKMDSNPATKYLFYIAIALISALGGANADILTGVIK